MIFWTRPLRLFLCLRGYLLPLVLCGFAWYLRLRPGIYPLQAGIPCSLSRYFV
ncbi:hypothetical protein BJX99DRAFT_223575 [Aspergillus californicus]